MESDRLVHADTPRPAHTGPFRFHLRTFEPQAIEALNQAKGLVGRRAIRPADEVLPEIAGAERVNGVKALGWFYHPDERVQLALLDNPNLTRRERRPRARHLRTEAIWAMAFAQAEIEGVAWTPVLDRIACSNLWPVKWVGDAAVRSDEFAVYAPRKITWLPLVDQAARLHNWISSGEPDRVELLLRYDADEFVGHVLRGLRTIDPDYLRRVLENRPSLGPFVARAKHLSPGARQALKDWAFADLLCAESRAASVPADLPAWRRKDFAYGALTLHELALNGPGSGEYPWTDRMAEALSDDEIRRLMALLDVGGDSQLGPAASAVRVLVASLGRLSEQDLIRLSREVRAQDGALILIAKARRATPRVWAACLQQGSHPELRREIAKERAALSDAEVRKGLSGTSSAEVLRRLAETATGDEFATVFRRLLKRDAEAAAAVLGANPHLAMYLTRGDLLPLLESDVQAHRLLAITLLPQLHTPEPRSRRT